jgi:hypothetical protein
MFPEAALCLEDKSGFGPLLPLHVICASENGSSKEIITYFLNTGGIESTAVRFGGLRPIDYFVKRLVLLPASGDQIQELLTIFDLLWNTLSRSQKRCGSHAMLRCGIRHGCMPFLLHLLQKPDFLVPKSFMISLQKGDLQRATAMTLLLPYLHALECFWSIPVRSEGFRHMMHSLGTNTSINKLTLTIPDVMKKCDMNALESFIATNQFIYDLSLSTESNNPDQTEGQLIDSIICGLRQNQRLKSFVLTGFEIEIGAVATLLIEAPACLELHFCSIVGTDIDPTEAWQNFFGLECLRVQSGFLKARPWLHLSLVFINIVRSSISQLMWRTWNLRLT